MGQQHDGPAIGIDIGGTKIAGALVDAEGRITHRERVETPADDTDAIIEATARLVTTLEDAAGDEVAGVGIACAAFLDARAGHVWFAPNLPWRDLDLAAAVTERVGRDVLIENDANAAAWGEYRFGAGSDCDDMLLVTVGTGVGGGCINDDRLVRGAFGIGGEIGHIVLDPSGPRCGCGNFGCLEVFASGTALVRNARELVESASPLGEALRARCGGDADRLSGQDVTELAQEGDGAAVELLEELGTHLGHGIASVCAVLDPGRIAIGGGVAAAGDLLVEPTRAAFAKRLIGRGHRPSPEIVRATLGNDAGIVGAATLAREGGA
ncbi:ROK family protein [Janibacter anophelis]|uniref:ROK family protein n=1 Tax=Janibacter anophelis TaxID=319054 RepID=UPI00082C3845|nr:ROK family protein [Janibacter anophelis]